jgi:hypothetical protein
MATLVAIARAVAPYPFAHEARESLPDKAERAVDGRALAPDSPADAASPSSG